MSILIPKILNGSKDHTNRQLTEFRDKCDINDLMYIWQNWRTPNCLKVAIAKVFFTAKWDISQAPRSESVAKKINSPIPNLSWYEFAIRDGFNNYEDFLHYFSNRKDKAEKFKCYQFYLIEVF